MPLLTKRRITGMKLEAVAGTAEVLTPATDCALNITAGPIQPNIGLSERQQQGSSNRNPGVPQAKEGTVEITYEICGSGVELTPVSDELALILQSCGLVMSTSTFTRFTTVASQKTVTIGQWEDGTYHELFGAMGNAVFTFRRGELHKVVVTYTGKYATESDVTLPTGITYPTVIPPSGLASFTIGSATPIAPEITLDLRNQVYLREHTVNDDHDTGYIAACITDQRPMISLSPERQLLSERDTLTPFFASTEASLTIEAGDEAGNTLTVECAKVQLAPRTFGERSGLKTEELVYDFNVPIVITCA